MERLHKLSAGFVFAFLCLHFANHLVGLQGIDAHLQFMDAVRNVYRHPIVEMAVVLAFIVQMLSGFALAKTIWREKKDLVHQLQAASGTYLILFVIIHLIGIFIGRTIFRVDTNFYYAAAGLMSPKWQYFFIPYYGLAIVSLFTHIGCIFYDVFKKTNKRAGYFFLILTAASGAYIAYGLLMMYSGRLYPVTLPDAYIDLFGNTQGEAVAPPLPEAPAADKPAAPETPGTPAEKPAEN